MHGRSLIRAAILCMYFGFVLPAEAQSLLNLHGTCKIYIEIKDKKILNASPEEFGRAMYCSGYLNSFLETTASFVTYLSEKNKTKLETPFCANREVLKTENLARILIKSYEEYPELADSPAALFLLLRLADIYACKS